MRNAGQEFGRQSPYGYCLATFLGDQGCLPAAQSPLRGLWPPRHAGHLTPLSPGFPAEQTQVSLGPCRGHSTAPTSPLPQLGSCQPIAPLVGYTWSVETECLCPGALDLSHCSLLTCPCWPPCAPPLLFQGPQASFLASACSSQESPDRGRWAFERWPSCPSHQPLSPQARVPGMDRDAAVGHMPALLCPRQHACLRRLHEPGLRLEQERVRRRAQQLLLGLLPDSGGGRPPGGPVIPAPRARLGEGAPRNGMWGLEDPRSEQGWAWPALSCLGVLSSLGTPSPPQQDLLVQPILATWLHSSAWPPSCPPCRIGGEKVILLSASAWGFITMATPLLAHLGSAHLAFMTFSRILTGLLQGGGPSAAKQGIVCARVCACVPVRMGACSGRCS